MAASKHRQDGSHRGRTLPDVPCFCSFNSGDNFSFLKIMHLKGFSVDSPLDKLPIM